MLAAFLGGDAVLASQVQTAVGNWTAETGKGLVYYAIMTSFGYPDSPMPMSYLDSYKPLIQQGLFQGVMYTWNPDYIDDQSTGQQCVNDIIAGKYDAYLHQEAQRARNDGYPIIIRFAPEFNGYWAGWGNDAVAFVLGWQHVVNIFRQEDASNVKWFWCANHNSVPSSRGLTEYYPGDDYVDYVGIDLYPGTEYNTWGTADHQFTDPSSDVYDTYTSKPFIVGEFGINSALSDAQNAQWLNGFFNSVDSRARIVVITHWVVYGGDLDHFPESLAVYKNRIANYLP